MKNSRQFKKSIHVFCGYCKFHNFVGCITNFQLPPHKHFKIIYRSYKNCDEEKLKNDVSQITFRICTIFNDVSALRKDFVILQLYSLGAQNTVADIWSNAW